MAADTVPTTEVERDARALHGADDHGGAHRIDPAEIAIGVFWTVLDRFSAVTTMSAIPRPESPSSD